MSVQDTIAACSGVSIAFGAGHSEHRVRRLACEQRIMVISSVSTLTSVRRVFFSEAQEQFAMARQIGGESIDALAALGHAYAVSGDTLAALEVRAKLTALSKERYVSPYDIALIHAALGENDQHFGVSTRHTTSALSG